MGERCELPQPKSNLIHFCLKMRHLVATILNIYNFAEKQLTKFSAGDAGDFIDAGRGWGERDMAPKCGSLPRDAGDLVRFISVFLFPVFVSVSVN